MNNPMKMYEWATATIRFSADHPDPTKAGKKVGRKASDDEFFDSFSRFLREFCESEDNDITQNDDTSDEEYAEPNESEGVYSALSKNYTLNDGYMQPLIDMLLFCNKNKGNGFLDAFNFSKTISGYRMQYMQKGAKSKMVEPQLLTRFLSNFCDNYMERGEGGRISKDSFLNFMLASQFMNDEESEEYKAIVNEINNRWDATIHPALTVFSNYYDVFTKASIGVILVKDALNSDAQKIFNLINTQGVKLTQAEIMSSKASWNVRVDNTSDETKAFVKRMYEAWEIPFAGDVVAWDYPAVFMDILKDKTNDQACFFFSYQRDNANKATVVYTNKTIGFQLLSALYKNSIKKDDMDLLVQNINDWGNEVGSVIEKMSILFSIILEHPFFKLLNCYCLKKDAYVKNGHKYGKSIQKLLTDAISIYFVSQLYLYADRNGYLETPSPKAKQMIKRNAFILFDKLVYECLRGSWSGSSDSRISNLLNKQLDGEYFDSISEDAWMAMIKEINEKGSIEGNAIKDQGSLEPLVYYIHCLAEKTSGCYENGFDVDHIVPQEAFKSPSVSDEYKVLENALFNLELLPMEINRKKKDNYYDDIWENKLDATERNMCQNASFVDSSDDLRNWSSIDNLSVLKTKRCEMIELALKNRKKNMDIK